MMRIRTSEGLSVCFVFATARNHASIEPRTTTIKRRSHVLCVIVASQGSTISAPTSSHTTRKDNRSFAICARSRMHKKWITSTTWIKCTNDRALVEFNDAKRDSAATRSSSNICRNLTEECNITIQRRKSRFRNIASSTYLLLRSFFVAY